MPVHFDEDKQLRRGEELEHKEAEMKYGNENDETCGYERHRDPSFAHTEAEQKAGRCPSLTLAFSGE